MALFLVVMPQILIVQKNTFNGIDLEGNSGNDIIVDAGHANQFNNIIAISKSMPKMLSLDRDPEQILLWRRELFLYTGARAIQFVYWYRS